MHSDTHFTPSNALQMHVYNHERVKKVLGLGAFTPLGISLRKPR